MIRLLESPWKAAQRQAAFVLGIFASACEDYNAKIAQGGAIPLLANMLRDAGKLNSKH